MKKIVIICGPTAVGKTKVGIRLAWKFNGEIVSADSQQVWRGCDIGTAKAYLTERSDVRHHLVDICDPTEHFDVEHFVRLADEAIAEILHRGRVPFVVGGTGMYIKMLERGLCDAPPRNLEFRKTFQAEIGGIGLLKLHDRLAKIDPESAAAIHPNDRTRIERALEIHHLTGVRASEFREKHGFSARRYDALKIGLNIDRVELYQRINDRVDQMIKNGLLHEVTELIEKYGPGCQPFAAVGYRELILHVRGEIGLEEAVDLTKRNSRHFAKRQLTWFRSDPEMRWFDPNLDDEIQILIAEFLQA